MKIKKVSQTVPTSAQVVNGYGTSQTNAYSQEYVNGQIGSLSSLTTTAKSNVVSAINELDSDKLDVDATAVDSTKWGGFTRDTTTVNNTDTWIPVISGDKFQHTTVQSIVSRGDTATTSTKGLMSGSDKTKLDRMVTYSAHYEFGQTTEAYINVIGIYSHLFIYGLNGGANNFFGTLFHTNTAEVSQITGAAPTFTWVSSTKIKIKMNEIYGALTIFANYPISITTS